MKTADLFTLCRLIRHTTATIVTLETDGGDIWKATKCVGSWRIICNGNFVADRVAS